MPWSQFTELFVLPMTKKLGGRRFVAGGASMLTRPQRRLYYAILPPSILNNTLR
ncbi:MAG: hypothetical protein VX694_09875 [Planctomycetota bacterium]|nr:hypothetical protein [Planctomycetota bacterium]